jgi:citrate lyase subunit beta/citryl-CoA lyase
VHPDQIGAVNAAYQPTSDEVAAAERIVAAFRDAESRGAAAVQVDGQMVDYPVAYRAQALLDAVRKHNAR